MNRTPSQRATYWALKIRTELAARDEPAWVARAKPSGVPPAARTKPSPLLDQAIQAAADERDERYLDGESATTSAGDEGMVGA